VMLKAIGNQMTFQKQLTFKLLEGGVGFYRKDDGTIHAPEYANTPEMEALGKQNFLNKETEAYKNHLDITSKSIKIADTLWKGIKDAISEPNSKRKKELIQNYVSLMYSVIPETAYKIGLEKYAAKIYQEAEVEDIRKKIQIDALVSAREDYTKTRKKQFLHDYTIAYMTNPDVAKDHNFIQPENLEGKYKSKETQEIELERKRKEALEVPTGTVQQVLQAQREGVTPQVKELRRSGATQISIEDKELSKQRARVKSPQFKSGVIEQVKKSYTSQEWKYLAKPERDRAVRMAMDVAIRNLYSGEEITYGIRNGKKGWFKEDGSLIRWDN